MAKVYVGYLYQIGPGAKKVHNCYSFYKGVKPADIPGGYILFEKIPFRKNVVREVITGKKIPVIAEGNSSFFGVHTFLKFDGTMYQKAKKATKEQIENYIKTQAKPHVEDKYNPDKDVPPKYFPEILEDLFNTGRENSNIGFFDKMKSKNKSKKQYSKLVEDMKDGSYVETAKTLKEPTSTFAGQMNAQRLSTAEYGVPDSNLMPTSSMTPGQSNQINSSINTPMGIITPMNAGNNSVPVIMPDSGKMPDSFRTDYENHNIDNIDNLDSNKKSDNNRNSHNIVSEINNQTLGTKNNVDEQIGVINEPYLKNAKTDEAMPKIFNEIPQNNSSNMGNEDLNLQPITNQQQVEKKNYAPIKRETVVSTFGRENTAIIKELAEIAGKGGEAVATIEGVEVSTKYLVDEKDLTEYFLAKRYNRTPESLTVRAVLANEESMNIVNKNRSL